MHQRPPVYETILFDYLRITPESLKESEETINERLNHAGTELAREDGDIFAINQCLHLAISLVMRKAATLPWTLDQVRQNPAFSGKDPTTVVTIAMLFKILQTELGPGASSEEREKRRRIRQRFEEINWLVGRSGMVALGICGEVVYDCFLCHNSKDKEAVKAVGEQLKACGLNPWLDEWELRPGLRWQQALEQQIQSIRSAAVFVGGNEIGPWQDVEQEAFLREFVKRPCPVIPVILPDCKETPQLPPFLRGLTWVDFRKQEPIPLKQLFWGITGYKDFPPSRTKVFISYSQDSPEHAKRVLDLANVLQHFGLEVILDQYVHPAPDEGWPRWMEARLAEANFVLMVCTETYRRRIMGQERPGEGLGVRWDGNLILRCIHNDKPRGSRFIPVLLEGGEPAQIPNPVQGHTYYRISHLHISDAGFQGLYRHLIGQPTTPPEIGPIQPRPPLPR